MWKCLLNVCLILNVNVTYNLHVYIQYPKIYKSTVNLAVPVTRIFLWAVYVCASCTFYLEVHVLFWDMCANARVSFLCKSKFQRKVGAKIWVYGHVAETNYLWSPTARKARHLSHVWPVVTKWSNTISFYCSKVLGKIICVGYRGSAKTSNPQTDMFRNWFFTSCYIYLAEWVLTALGSNLLWRKCYEKVTVECVLNTEC